MQAHCDRWILASASPRRRELLAAAGQRFDVESSGVEEGGRGKDESPSAFARRLAAEKAAEVSRRHPSRWVLAADTIVVIDDDVLGKPRDEADARAMLVALAGREHRVITGFVLLAPGGRVAAEESVSTSVAFRGLSSAEIAAYVATGEPADKAGAYAIQGGAAGFVSALDGSYSNVVGLPLEAVERALRATGLWCETSREGSLRA